MYSPHPRLFFYPHILYSIYSLAHYSLVHYSGNSMKIAHNSFSLFLFILFFSALTSPAQAYSNGTELAQAVYDRPDGKNAFSRGLMLLVEKGHKPRVRQMYTFREDRDNGDIVSLIRFEKPADIKNTGLLTVDHDTDKDTEQWIFLPAINKARRISSSRKGGHFVGSDILYEDLRDRKVSADKHTLLGEEKINGIKALKLESIPLDPDSSVYSKRISWIHPVSLVALRVDFYMGGEKPVKRTLVKKLEKKQGLWTIMSSVAIDLKSQHETHLKMKTVLYDQEIPSDLISLRYLEDPQREKQLLRTLMNK